MASANAPFNSVWGYSVSIPPTTVIDINGNVTANVANFGTMSATYANVSNLSIGNLTITGNFTLPPNVVISGSQISGNIRAPGADTQIMFNIGGNLAADPDFTWNPVINFLHVNGNACFEGGIVANYFSGDGSNLNNVNANTANYVLMNNQPNITSVGNLTSLTVTGNTVLPNVGNIRIGGGNAGEVLTTYGNGVVYWSGDSGQISNGTSNVKVLYQNGPVSISSANTANIFTVYGPGLYVSPYNNTSVIVANAEMWVSGNVRATVFDGDGSRLSNINAANIVGLPFIATANTVTQNSQPNITSVGTLTSLNVSGVSNLGSVGNVVITGGANGQVLVTDGAGNLNWQNAPQPNTIVDGTSNVIVYPSSDVAISSAGVANVFVVSSTGSITNGGVDVTGNTNVGGELDVVGNVSVGTDLTVVGNTVLDTNLSVGGVSTLGPVGNVVITGGLANQFLMTDGAGTLSWQDTPIANLLENGSSNVSIPVASGNIEFTVNGVNSVTITQDGIVANTVTANTLMVGNLSVGNTSGNFSGFFTGNTYDTANASFPGFTMGYRDVPQLVLGGNITLTPASAGKHYYANSTVITNYSITIPENIGNTFAMGTEVQIVNMGTANITVIPDPLSPAPVRLYRAGNSVGTVPRVITSYGVATLLKVDTDTWVIYGTGIV